MMVESPAINEPVHIHAYRATWDSSTHSGWIELKGNPSPPHPHNQIFKLNSLDRGSFASCIRMLNKVPGVHFNPSSSVLSVLAWQPTPAYQVPRPTGAWCVHLVEGDNYKYEDVTIDAESADAARGDAVVRRKINWAKQNGINVSVGGVSPGSCK